MDYLFNRLAVALITEMGILHGCCETAQDAPLFFYSQAVEEGLLSQSDGSEVGDPSVPCKSLLHSGPTCDSIGLCCLHSSKVSQELISVGKGERAKQEGVW